MISTHIMTDRGVHAYLVEVEPPIPLVLDEERHEFAIIMLGMTAAGVALPLDRDGTVVDIFVPREVDGLSEGDARLVHIGTGTVHQSMARAMECSPLDRGFAASHQREGSVVSMVEFLGEQDGVAERNIKSQWASLFEGQSGVARAYLAKVRYPCSGQVAVALCLVPSSRKVRHVAQEANGLFARMFKSGESLDTIVLTAEQEPQLRSVCDPFWGA